MTWNHRIIMQPDPHDNWYCYVAEVYYDSAGNIETWSDPVYPSGINMDEVRQELTRMLEACEKPMLIENGDKLK